MLFFLILIIIVCVLLTLVVLIQNPKGGGIAANFSAPNQIMGANRSSDVVEKATWILAIALIVLSLSSNFARPYGEQETNSTNDLRSKEGIENATGGSINQPPPVTSSQTPPNGDSAGK